MRSLRNTRLFVESLEARETPATLYVSPSGVDTNAGTLSAPLKTLQAAANRVSAGDTVVVSSGTYLGFNLTRDGTATARITFKADAAAAPGSVIINQPNSYTGRDGINLEGASHITIEGFTVTGQARAGIRSVLNEFVIIRNNVTDNNGIWGIFTGFSSDIRIEDNQASRSQQQHGIYVSNSADRPVIRGNNVFENRQSGIQLNADASMGGDGIITGAVLENNIIRANGAGGGASINLDGVQNSDIRNNVIDDARATGIALFRTDGAAGSKNNRIVNNTVVVDNSLSISSGRWAVTIMNGSTGNVLRNNVFFSTQSFRGAVSVTSDSLAGLVSDYNAVEDRFSVNGGSSAIGLAAWQSATGQDAHSLRLVDVTALNVLFVNRTAGDYHLAAHSAAIDRGNSTGAPATDFEGQTRPSGAGHDIGADEFLVRASSSASYAGTDTVTRGTWRGVYGADGYSIAQSGTDLPDYATLTLQGHSNWLWKSSTTDTRALQKPAPATDRIAAAWYGQTFTMDVSVGSGQQRVSLYMLDWTNYGRSQRIEVLDAATGQVLDTRTISGFQSGVWLSWDLSGDVRFRITKLAGPNAVLNGVFFGVLPAGTTASFIGTDTVTRGTWRGVYGADGYSMAQGATSLPTYATATPRGHSNHTWAASTNDTRALQKPAPATDRLAAVWYGQTFTMDVSVGSTARRVSLYMMDWTGGRSQRIEVLDAATGKVLDTRMVSGFGGGVWLSWDLTGAIQFRFTKLSGYNAILNGVFFGESTDSIA